MKKLELEPFSLRLRTPVRAAWGTLERRELLRVRLRDTGNDFGVGEAAPLEDYDGVSLAAVRAELERGEPSLPHAVAAVDMAEWDLRGRRDARPVAALLVDDPLDSVPVNALVGAEDRETASAQAAQAVAAGFRCLKVKVGVGDDAGRLAAVRAAVGPDVALRIDANGAWTVDEAVAALGSLASVGIELCEEPVHGVEALARGAGGGRGARGDGRDGTRAGRLGVGSRRRRVPARRRARRNLQACSRRRRRRAERAATSTSRPPSTGRLGWRPVCMPPRRCA